MTRDKFMEIVSCVTNSLVKTRNTDAVVFIWLPKHEQNLMDELINCNDLTGQRDFCLFGINNKIGCLEINNIEVHVVFASVMNDMRIEICDAEDISNAKFKYYPYTKPLPDRKEGNST